MAPPRIAAAYVRDANRRDLDLHPVDFGHAGQRYVDVGRDVSDQQLVYHELAPLLLARRGLVPPGLFEPLQVRENGFDVGPAAVLFQRHADIIEVKTWNPDGLGAQGFGIDIEI